MNETDNRIKAITDAAGIEKLSKLRVLDLR